MKRTVDFIIGCAESVFEVAFLPIVISLTALQFILFLVSIWLKVKLFVEG